jgi:hypothetical protein
VSQYLLKPGLDRSRYLIDVDNLEKVPLIHYYFIRDRLQLIEDSTNY